MEEQQARHLIETIDRQIANLKELSAHPTSPVSEAKTFLDDLKNSLEQAKDLANESIAWTTRSPWALTPFGMVIGVLVALSTKDGTSYAVIGLLFAAIGGSVVSWYGTTLTELQRIGFVRHVCALSCGLLLGLVLALGLRLWGDYLVSDQPTSVQELANEVRTKLLQKISTELDTPGNLTEAQWKRFEPIVSPAAGIVMVKPPTDPRPNPFGLHAAARQRIDDAIKELDNAIKAAEGDKVSTKELMDVLGTLKEAANDLATPRSQ